MSNAVPLQYQISDWKQLTSCMSNTSRDLKIGVRTFQNNSKLTGTLITVSHSTFGTIFACIIDPHGSCIYRPSESIVPILTTEQVLQQLKLFGFYVTFKEDDTLPQSQLDFLRTLNTLHFDKIRMINTWWYDYGIKQYKQYIVAFNVSTLGDWINAAFQPSKANFITALENGAAMNISSIPESVNSGWSWVFLNNKVLNISDILHI